MGFNPSEIKFTPVEELPEELREEEEGGEKKKISKRRKPKYGKGTKYRGAPANVINKGVVGAINSTVLKTKKKQLQPKDSEVGEAFMYMIDYYVAIDVDHPALVVLTACMGLAFATVELANLEDDQEKVIKYASEDMKPSLEEK